MEAWLRSRWHVDGLTTLELVGVRSASRLNASIPLCLPEGSERGRPMVKWISTERE